MKFLVFWSFQAGLKLTPEFAKIVMDMRDYGSRLHSQGKVERYYHLVGRRGGAWIFNVESNEELERLLAGMPVYNFAEFQVYALAEMK